MSDNFNNTTSIQLIENIGLKKEAVNSKDYNPSPAMYMFIFIVWITLIVYFQPRLWMLLDMANNTASAISLTLFIVFINFAWLYGIYNVGIIIFALLYKSMPKTKHQRVKLLEFPQVAILYTTCNDFVRESVLSCVQQDYPNYTVYILDDSKDDLYKNQIDSFAAEFPNVVKVIRRSDRIGFKAGNMNNALKHHCKEKYFAIADADEILPVDFLTKLVPDMESDPHCGFVQANHRANPNSQSALAKDMGIGIDLHWKWYQPLRNAFGFVMFLGHGALLRRKVWEEIGGFPDIVSEDLGFAIHAREAGYRGKFVEDVICYEDFPDTVRSFRVRHMKWTRGTSEFLHQKFSWLIKAKNITWQEKLDILFPTLNLPLTMLYFLFMINANLVLPFLLGEWRDMTFELGGRSLVVPILSMNVGFNAIYDLDFYIITMLTFFSPILCFIIGLYKTPKLMFNFISKSTSLYAALSPLSTIGVLAYAVTGKAIFLVTGETENTGETNKNIGWIEKTKNNFKNFLTKSHPDNHLVKGFEIATAVIFGAVCILMFQLSFLGLCFAFALLPLMHVLGWNHRISKFLVHIPFVLMLMGIGLSFISMAGMQSTFFGYGFHF